MLVEDLPGVRSDMGRDTRRRLLENLRLVKLSVMFSVTAPGADLAHAAAQALRPATGISALARHEAGTGDAAGCAFF